jgi:acetyltransferase-like isoleucine patch superfamily enzyme
MADHVRPDLREFLRQGYHEIPLISVTEDVKLGEGVLLSPFVNLWGCTLGNDTTVGAYTEIGKGVVIGERCKIGAHVFIPPGVTIEDEVFIGPGVFFGNDRYPKAVGEWTLEPTFVKKGASIGLGSIVLPGLTIGEGVTIGAGTIVTHDVAPHSVMRNVLPVTSRTYQQLWEEERLARRQAGRGGL